LRRAAAYARAVVADPEQKKLYELAAATFGIPVFTLARGSPKRSEALLL
jgi:hypothetical protein